MTTTPDEGRDREDRDDEDRLLGEPGAQGAPGAEIGVTEGEGTTFEPEEDPEAGT